MSGVLCLEGFELNLWSRMFGWSLEGLMTDLYLMILLWGHCGWNLGLFGCFVLMTFYLTDWWEIPLNDCVLRSVCGWDWGLFNYYVLMTFYWTDWSGISRNDCVLRSLCGLKFGGLAFQIGGRLTDQEQILNRYWTNLPEQLVNWTKTTCPKC